MQVDTESKGKKKVLTIAYAPSQIQRSLLILSIICDPRLTYGRLQAGAIYHLKYLFNDPTPSLVNNKLYNNQIKLALVTLLI